ncbi:MAG: RHS repeat-associated core domain-containing protein [Acutalibacteraceae bacterium]
MRTEKKVTQNSITTTYNYIWNDGKLVSQSDGTNTFYFFYNDSKYAPDGFVLNGTDTYLYTKNLQGDITGIADANGNIVTTYIYDAWGKITSVTGTQASTIGTANPFRYRGYCYDDDTGLFYVGSRYYDPEVGRFISPDAVIDNRSILGTNLYSYCWNNPVNMHDQTGYYAATLVLTASATVSLSGALTGIMASISASIASIKTAIATSWFIPVCIAATAIAIVGIVCAVNRVMALSATAASTISAVKTNVNKGGVKPGGGNTVYVITRKGTADVVYAGRTCNFSARKSAHQKKFPSNAYTMIPVATGLSLTQARALEQAIITAYTIDTLKNMINSISPSKWGNFKTEFDQMGTLIKSWLDPE